MKTVLVLSILLCAAFAAPGEDKEKAPEAAVEDLKEQAAAAPEMEDKMTMTKDEELEPEDSVPVPGKSRFNFCPNGWFSHDSRCFLFVSSAMNWYSAEEHCKSLGAHLASATNPREYSFLQQITRTASQSIAWLGGFYLQGWWLWIDHEGFYYNNWYSQLTPSKYPCTYLNTCCGWSNSNCGYSKPFICSKNAFGC